MAWSARSAATWSSSRAGAGQFRYWSPWRRRWRRWLAAFSRWRWSGPGGRVVPRRWLLISSAGVSAVLVVYGGLNVAVGALVLSGRLHPSGSVNRTALRWHVGVWDLWFLLWGILLALATVGYWRRTAHPSAA